MRHQTPPGGVGGGDRDRVTNDTRLHAPLKDRRADSEREAVCESRFEVPAKRGALIDASH